MKPEVYPVWMRKPTTTAAFPGQFGKPDWYESGIVRILEDMFNLCCRKPIQTKQTQWALQRMRNWTAPKAVPWRARERTNGGNWETEEMKWFTKLATERISRMLKSLTSLMSLRTLKSKQRGYSGQHSWTSPSQRCLTAQWCGWDHPASQSTQAVGLLRGLHKDKSNKDLWGRLAKHSPDDRTITQLL